MLLFKHLCFIRLLKKAPPRLLPEVLESLEKHLQELTQRYGVLKLKLVWKTTHVCLLNYVHYIFHFPKLICFSSKFTLEKLDVKAFGEDGYGAKANKVLATVKGKDFRHEKTKRKRGTYRGGEITLASNSFKYDD